MIDVAANLSGKHLVVTGFTGFLAKVYVALLLEYVPDIGRITLLVRPRSKRLDAMGRVEKAFDTSPVFRRLRALHGDGLGRWLSDRVDALDADIERPLCGLDPSTLDRLASADLVLHCAGLTDFQPDPLRAVAVNVAGALHAADARVGTVDRMLTDPAIRQAEQGARLVSARQAAAAEVEAVLKGLVQLRVQLGLVALVGETAPVQDRLRELSARLGAIDEVG